MKRKGTLLFLFVTSLFSCAENRDSPKTYSVTVNDVFSSFVSVNYDSQKGDLGKEITELLTKIDALTDAYEAKESANVYALNLTNEKTKVDPLLFSLLRNAYSLQEKTEGYFSPLLGSLTSLWKNTLYGNGSDAHFVPKEEDIEKAKASVPPLLTEKENTTLLFDESSSSIERVGKAKIDLGAVAKGFAIEEVKNLLKRNGSTHYLVNGGTSSIAMGKTTNDGPFHVRLRYTGDEIIRYDLEDTDASMSSIYEQLVKVNGVSYSHLIHPKTGLPLTSFSSVFLVGENSTELDALSTACMFVDLQKIQEWEKKYDFKASVFKEGNEHAELLYENTELIRSK